MSGNVAVDNYLVINWATSLNSEKAVFGHYTNVEVLTEILVFCLGASIQTNVVVDPDTGLSTTTSTLEYAAEKKDADAQFSCSTQHPVGVPLVSSPVTFSITCELLDCTNNNKTNLCKAVDVFCRPAGTSEQSERLHCFSPFYHDLSQWKVIAHHFALPCFTKHVIYMV